jgi:predicted glutamine amidotransferase
MCELLGMNCNVPTDICFSLTGFHKRGGHTGIHADGWGIAFFEGRGVRLFLDPQPSAQSQVAELVRGYPIRSCNVIAHIRKATQGQVSLENTHPFQRELWGRYWVFAHNGNLPDFRPAFDGSFLPVGDTDSERIFCWLLQNLRKRFDDALPPRDELFAELHRLTLPLSDEGSLNFLLSDGEWLIAHCSTRLSYVVRRAPFQTAHLKDEDVTVDFSAVTTPLDRVAVIATQPLTDNEAWSTMAPGSLWLFQDGEAVAHLPTHPGPMQTPTP